MRRRAAVALATAVTALVGMGAITSTANASAFGCQYVGGFGFSFKGLSLQAPVGFLCHDIRGSKKQINSEAAGYGPAPGLYGILKSYLCGWRIDFVYRRNTDGAIYLRNQGPTNNSCSFTPTRSVGARTLAHYGTACAELYVNGTRRATQCHNIKA